MRLLAAFLALAAVFCSIGPTRVAGQSALELVLAQEFLALETAGWRLPDPVEECLTGLSLRALEPMAYGSDDLVDTPELVDPPGPHYRVIRVEVDPGNRRQRIVQFEWLLRGSGEGARAIRDSFIYRLGGDAGGGGRATMQREPEHMVIRRECFGG